MGKNLQVPQRAVWWQLARLSASGLGSRLHRMWRLFGDVCYAGWWWTVIAMVAVLGWLAAMVLPRLAWRWALFVPWRAPDFGPWGFRFP